MRVYSILVTSGTSILWVEGQISSYFLPVKISMATRWTLAKKSVNKTLNIEVQLYNTSHLLTYQLLEILPWPCFPVLDVDISTILQGKPLRKKGVRWRRFAGKIYVNLQTINIYLSILYLDNDVTVLSQRRALHGEGLGSPRSGLLKIFVGHCFLEWPQRCDNKSIGIWREREEEEEEGRWREMTSRQQKNKSLRRNRRMLCTYRYKKKRGMWIFLLRTHREERTSRKLTKQGKNFFLIGLRVAENVFQSRMEEIVLSELSTIQLSFAQQLIWIDMAQKCHLQLDGTHTKLVRNMITFKYIWHFILFMYL